MEQAQAGAATASSTAPGATLMATASVIAGSATGSDTPGGQRPPDVAVDTAEFAHLELEPLAPAVLNERDRVASLRVYFGGPSSPSTAFGTPRVRTGPVATAAQRLQDKPEFRAVNPGLQAFIDEADDLDDAVRLGERFGPETVPARWKQRFDIKRMSAEAMRQRRIDIDEILSSAVHSERVVPISEHLGHAELALDDQQLNATATEAPSGPAAPERPAKPINEHYALAAVSPKRQKERRQNTLDPVIAEAIGAVSATGAVEALAVYAKLKAMARQGGHPLLIRADNDGVHYRQGSSVRILTRKLLGQRLTYRAKKTTKDD